MPPIGTTLSSEQFNQMNTASAPLPSNATVQPTQAGSLPGVGQTITADQFKALQAPQFNASNNQAIKDFTNADNTMKEASGLYFHGLLKTYAGAVGLNSETGQWEMPDFLKEAGSGQSQATDIGSNGHPIGDFAAGARNIASGAVRSGASLINVVFAPITQAISSIAEAATDNPTFQGLASGALSKLADAGKAIQDLREAHPEAARNIDAASAFLLTAAGGEGLNKPVSDVFPVKSKFTAATKPPEPPVPPVANDAAIKAQVKDVAADWHKPTLENTASFNKARDVLAKSPETPQFIAEHGLNPFSHIEDGKYATEDAAQSFRDTAGKLSEDTLRPSLQMADYTTPKTAVEDLTQSALKYAENDYGATVDDVEVISSKIASKIEALQRRYADGMSLTDKEIEKIKYAKNGGFSPVKDPAVNNNAIANRALADAIDQSLQENVPKDIDYKGFKTYQSKYYKAADYLDSLNGKKAPVSFVQQVVRNIAKFGGAKAGAMFGGDIVSSFAGYQLGKALEIALENLTNPMRDAFLRNLKITNPEAYTKIEAYIGKEKAAQATRPRLSAPKEMGTAENPIIAKGKISEDEKMAQKINREPVKETPLLGPGKKGTIYGETVRLGQGTTYEKSADMIARKYTYNPVDKRYYPKGQYSDVAKRAAELTKANDGVTIRLNGDVPKSGYVVAPAKNTEFKISANLSTSDVEKAIDSYIDKHYNDLKDANAHFGSWKDGDNIVMDVSHVYEDVSDAVNLAKKANQDGIFNLNNFQTIYAKDYEKELGSANPNKGKNKRADQKGNDEDASGKGSAETKPKVKVLQGGYLNIGAIVHDVAALITKSRSFLVDSRKKQSPQE